MFLLAWTERGQQFLLVVDVVDDDSVDELAAALGQGDEHAAPVGGIRLARHQALGHQPVDPVGDRTGSDHGGIDEGTRGSAGRGYRVRWEPITRASTKTRANRSSIPSSAVWPHRHDLRRPCNDAGVAVLRAGGGADARAAEGRNEVGM